MKIKTYKQIETEIEIDLPFYYRSDIIGETYHCEVYGRIDKEKITVIERNSDNHWEIEIRPLSKVDLSTYACYMDGTHDSTTSEFFRALDNCKAFIGKI